MKYIPSLLLILFGIFVVALSVTFLITKFSIVLVCLIGLAIILAGIIETVKAFQK